MPDESQTKRDAKEFARKVIERSFKQSIDDEELEAVAEKVAQAVPPLDDSH